MHRRWNYELQIDIPIADKCLYFLLRYGQIQMSIDTSNQMMHSWGDATTSRLARE